MKKAICILWLAPLLGAEPPGTYLLRGATVHSVSGPAIPVGSVLIRDGLIEAAGENVSAPAGAWVIDAQGLHVYPGLIDALSTWGMPEASPPSSSGPPAGPPQRSSNSPAARGPEDRPLNTSWLRAADQLQASDKRIEAARNAGFTTAVVFPIRGIFAGQGAVINLAGERPGRMVIHPAAGLYLTLMSNSSGGGFPSSLMGTIAYIRQVFLDAARQRQALELYGKGPQGLKRPDYDRAVDGVHEARRILLPATTAVEIDRMLRFGKELGVPFLLYGCQQAYEAAGKMKASGAGVLVNLKWPEKNRDADPAAEETLDTLELREKAPSSPAALEKAGVPFALYSGGIAEPREILQAVRKAVDSGLSRDTAVRAMTLSAAELYGVADRLGSIEKGKIANLVVTSGELFQEKTQVKYVFVDGIKFEPPAPQPAPAKEASK